jgi:hypothetical protein
MPKAGRSAARRVQPQRVPRRVSGPATGRAAARPSPHRSPTVGARALSVVRSLPDHSLLDRLVRGRAWIPVLGVLLAGIVATQVEILKLGTSLGRSLERTTTLQSTNESLQANIASLDDAGRIERLATRMGLITPSASLVTFLPTRPEGQLGQAIANIHPPDPAGFAQLLQSQIAAAELQAPPTTTASSATTSLTAGQSTGVAGSSTPTGSTTTGATGTGSPGTTSAGLGSTGPGTTAGATTTAGGTATAGATTTAGGGTDTAGGTPTVAPAGAGTTGTGTTSPGVTTGGGGGGAPAGGAGLPATTSSQSGTTTGG